MDQVHGLYQFLNLSYVQPVAADTHGTHWSSMDVKLHGIEQSARGSQSPPRFPLEPGF